jgi:hypothetical protein
VYFWGSRLNDFDPFTDTIGVQVGQESKGLSMKFKGLPYFLGLLGFWVLLGGAPGADAEERYYPWSAGLRGGPSYLSQDPVGNTNTEGQLGPLFNGVIAYDLHKYVSLGLDAEWEQHKIDRAALTLGDASAASLFFRVEGHLEKTQPISPYVLLAVGCNINSFSEDDAYLAECGQDCRINIDDTFAIKAGLGVDLFVLFENAAINFELAWKYNKADIDFISGTETVASDDYNGNTLYLLIGFRYRFPIDPFD